MPAPPSSSSHLPASAAPPRAPIYHCTPNCGGVTNVPHQQQAPLHLQVPPLRGPMHYCTYVCGGIQTPAPPAPSSPPAPLSAARPQGAATRHPKTNQPPTTQLAQMSAPASRAAQPVRADLARSTTTALSSTGRLQVGRAPAAPAGCRCIGPRMPARAPGATPRHAPIQGPALVLIRDWACLSGAGLDLMRGNRHAVEGGLAPEPTNQLGPCAWRAGARASCAPPTAVMPWHE